jgi:hypothetical protein
MGPGGHFCRGERRRANTNAYAATDANPQAGAIGKAAPHASAEAIEFPYRFLVLITNRS